MSRSSVLSFVSFIVVGLLSQACSGTSAATAPPSPQSVGVVNVRPERVTLSDEWVATLDGNVNAQIRPQVSGYLIRRTYQEGAAVRKGQVLFEIDERPFAAVLAQARANRAEAQAQLGKAQRDLARDKPIAEARAIPQSQLDNDQQAVLAADAAVQSADAAVQSAELNVGFTKVTSLIDGIAAIATAQIGDLVTPSTLLTTVSQTDPIKVYFPISEQQYLRMTSSGRGDVLGSRSPLTLTLADDTVYPRTGTMAAVDREIDPKTGTIRISALFPNPAHTLRPGQYGRVRAETRAIDGALLVPQRAVTEIQGTYQLRVVGPDNTAHVRRVTAGERVGSRWIITEGLQPGDSVIVEGASIRDGERVTPTAAE
ncbi:MAG TPA: efflux RND transporter periplasmic adaptor subunit [Vicinamibacterales bacterium]|jgi:membrane fusion protein (multidrug efflux system)